MSTRGTTGTIQVAIGVARLLATLAYVVVTSTTGIDVGAQEAAPPDQRSVYLIHASPAVGPVDVYIDGAIVLVGLGFSAVSDPIPLAMGSHDVQVVPSGRSRDEELVTGSVSLDGVAAADIALLGPADDLSLNVYPLDRSPLPPGLARIGAVLGSFDTGPVDLTLTGGDLLFPTIEVTGATEFADVAAGVYDLEVRYAGTEATVLNLTGTTLEAGVVYRVFIVGESAIGDLQPLIPARPTESVTLIGHPAWIQPGDCTAVSVTAAIASLTIVAKSPFADRAGHPAAAATESSYTAIAVPFEALIDQPHAIVVADVAEAEEAPARAAACGEIGGTQAVNGSLVVGLRAQPGSATAGIAVVTANLLDPALTDVSVFIADGLLGDAQLPDDAGTAPDDAGAETDKQDATAARAPATPESGD